MSEQLDLETLVLNAERARRAEREQVANVADEQRDSERLAAMLNEAHEAMRDLCPECAAIVNERFSR